jgi:hypothetical protein
LDPNSFIRSQEAPVSHLTLPTELLSEGFTHQTDPFTPAPEDSTSSADRSDLELYYIGRLAGLQDSESTLSPSLGRSQGPPVDSSESAAFFEALGAEVALAAARAIDFWSPQNTCAPSTLLAPQGLGADRSALTNGAAFVAAAAAADAVAAVTGEPAADADESAALPVAVEDSAAGEDGSGWEWWWW